MSLVLDTVPTQDPAPMPNPAPEPEAPSLEAMSLVDLLHEIKRAHDWDEDDSRLIPAYKRALKVARTLYPTPAPEPEHPLLARQALASMHREWRMRESAPGVYVVEFRTRGAGDYGAWNRSGNAIEAISRDEAARVAGSRYSDRPGMDWCDTEDGAAARGEAGRISRMEVAK